MTPNPNGLTNKKNNGQSPEELAVAHGIANYQRVVTERDELNHKLTTAEQLIAVYKIEVEGLRAQVAAESTRIQSYQQERDDAVANLVIYQTLFTTVQSLLRTFGIEHAPIVRPVDDEQQSG